MRLLKKFPCSISIGFVLVIQWSILVYDILAVMKSVGEARCVSLFFSIVQVFWALMFIPVFYISLSDELESYKKEGGKNMFGKSKKDGLISRYEIANMLKQYQRNELSATKLTKADIEFIKALLLPVKGKLIKGLQNYKGKRNIEFDAYQFEYADKCIQGIRDKNLYLALDYLKSIFESGSPFQIYCNYCELVVNDLLVSNIIELCDKTLAEMAESEKKFLPYCTTDFIQEAASDAKQLDNLDIEPNCWHKNHSNLPLHKYFKLTDEEHKFIHKSVSETFRAIVACRKNNVSIETFVDGIQDKISCFFSALGAPSRRVATDFQTKMRGKML